MIRNILQLLFCVLPFALPLALYKCRRPFMATFYHAMTRSAKARKLYVQVLLILLLLFHYVYTVGHPGEFGVLPSTALCAVLFSFKRADRWLRALCDRLRAAPVHDSGNRRLSSSGSPFLSLCSGNDRM